MPFILLDTDLFIFNDKLSWLEIMLYNDIRNYYKSKNRPFYTKSKRKIADFFNVSEIAIKKAISKLKKYGLIDSIPIKEHHMKKSYYLRPRPIKQSILYKELYNIENGSNEQARETERIIEELKQKWSK